MADLGTSLIARARTRRPHPAGFDLPDRFGAIEDELAALAGGAAVFHRPWTARLEVGGEDRLRLLNALVTVDLRGLASGRGTYGFFTTREGRILSDVVVECRDDALSLEIPAERLAAVAGHVADHVVADRVETEPAPAGEEILLAGPGAEAVATGLWGRPPADPWSHRRAPGEGGVIRRERRLGVPALSVTVPAAGAAAVHAELLAAGARPVGLDAVQLARIRGGIAWYGWEFSSAPDGLAFPQETGLEPWGVDYEKGCYLGQEVIARIHFRGKVNRSLWRLALGERPPAVGTPVLDERGEVGRVGAAVRPPDAARAVALAIVHRRAAEEGARLTLPDGTPVALETPSALS